MPDKNPTKADVARRKSSDEVFEQGQKATAHASQISRQQDLGGGASAIRKNATPRLQKSLESKGNPDYANHFAGIERDRAMLRGQGNLESDRYWKDQAAKKNDARDKKNPLAQAKGKR